MSKFFNETLKTRRAGIQEGSKQAGFQVLADAAFSPAPAPSPADLGSARLAECTRLACELSNLLRGRFKGSDSVESVLESYRGLRTRLIRMRSERGLRSVIITSASQGEGKTFTSLNLASCCAQLHEMRTLLIDADIRSHGLSRTLGSPPGLGLADVLSGGCQPEKAILATDIPNLYVMTSGASSIASAELFAGQRWQDLIAWSNESFKLVLVDSPPVLNLADVELMAAVCDGVLIVVRALQTKRDVLEKCARQLDSKKLLGAVYNAAEYAADRYRYYGAETAIREK